VEDLVEAVVADPAEPEEGEVQAVEVVAGPADKTEMVLLKSGLLRSRFRSQNTMGLATMNGSINLSPFQSPPGTVTQAGGGSSEPCTLGTMLVHTFSRLREMWSIDTTRS